VLSHLTATDRPQTVSPGQDPPSPRPIRAILRHPIVVHVAVLLGYIGAGIAVTWPHATYLAGRLPYTRDAGSYTWGFWWMAHCVLQLSDPWTTNYLAAPVGASLGMHALMPLPGAVFTPITVLYGPAFSYNLLSVIMPGLLAYAMYRLARLWVPSQLGAIAAGVFFGFSSMLDFQTWVHINLAAGALFLPITLEAVVRLRRRPGLGQGLVLGLVLAAAMLTDQESAVLCLILAGLALLPWLFALRPAKQPAGQAAERPAGQSAEQRIRFWRGLRAGMARAKPAEAELADITIPDDRAADDPAPDDRESQPGFLSRRIVRPLASFALGRLRWLRTVPRLLRSVLPRLRWRRFLLITLTGVIAVGASIPQLVAIVHANAEGSPPTKLNASSYLQGIKVPDMFLPSPRITWFGLTFTHSKNASTFGALATFLALVGLVLAWRQRRNTKLLLLLWFGSAALALGGDLITGAGIFLPLRHYSNGIVTSLILPYSWFIKIPGLSGFREPSRIAELGLIPVALLAAFTVNWIRYHARWLLIAVLALAVLEAGLTTPPHARSTMTTSYPALDNPIAADHSNSIVVDVPFGLRGGTGVTGLPFPPQTQVLASHDGHPLADALLSRVPTGVRDALSAEPFYADLLSTQTGHYKFTPEQFLAARQNAAAMHVGWVILWVFNKHLRNFLVQAGFRYLYRADGASVWSPVGYANATLPVP
jgi:hypothetical protein